MNLRKELDRICNIHGEHIKFERDTVAWQYYINEKRKMLESKSIQERMAYLKSEANYFERCNYYSASNTGVWVKPGDICYIDFGCAYQCEMGYLHFGLIYKVIKSKVFVIPITSNGNDNKNQFYDLGKIEPMSKKGYLILHDMKFINNSRVIDVKAKIDTTSELFADIRKRILSTLE